VRSALRMVEYEFGRPSLAPPDQSGPRCLPSRLGELMSHPDLATCTPIKSMVDRAKGKDPMSYGIQILGRNDESSS